MSGACLTEAQLAQMLVEGLGEEARQDEIEHIGSCANCRRRLQLLAGMPDTSSFCFGPAGHDESPSPALAKAMKSLASESPPRPGTAPAGPSLEQLTPYLSPTTHPGSLGRLAGYEVLEPVAAGGMGLVLRAFETSLKRIVALKVLAPALAVGGSARARFLREARAAAAIRHDQVVGIYAVGEAGDLPFLAMEFIAGESLAQRLARDGPLPIGEAIRLAREVAAGLAAAHALGTIHRDIKPGNILIDQANGRFRITDFGLAQAADDPGLTRTGFIAGTPEYLSPEQAAGEPLDPRSDLFSLGCLLHAACMGASPFRATTTLAVLRRVADHHPTPLHTLNPAIPAWFSDVVQQLMAKRAGDRFGSALELLDALAVGESRPAASTRPHFRRLALAAAACVVVLAISLMALRPSAPPPFLVQNSDGSAPRSFSDVSAALAAAGEDSILELRWNGERELTPVVLPQKTLTIRAGRQYRPVWVSTNQGMPALTASSGITLQGLAFAVREVPGANKTNFGPSPGEPGSNANGPPPLMAIAPGNAAVLRAVRGPVNIEACEILRYGGGGGPDDSFVALQFEQVDRGTISDTAIYLGTGKAVICRGAPAWLAISNCAVFASQAVWLHPLQGRGGTLILSQSSFKGGTVVRFPKPAAFSPVSIEARSNLFNAASLIEDARPGAPPEFPKWCRWSDAGNLYSLVRAGRREIQYIRFEARPDLEPVLHFFRRNVCTL